MDTMNILILVIGAFSVLTNGVLLIILYLDPLKNFRTTTNYLIISLTISDFITGLVACLFPFGGTNFVYVVLTYVFLWATILSSFSTIFFMSCERLVVVVYPLKAKYLITKRRVFNFIAANWLLSGILGGLVGGLHDPQLTYYMSVLLILMLLMILLLVAIYVAIILKTRRKPKLIRESIRIQRGKILHEERRLTSVLFLLVAIYLVTVVPYLSASFIYCVYNMNSKITAPNTLLIVVRYYFPIELINFAANPIIYAWRLPNYRKSLLHYLRKLPFVKESGGLQQATMENPLTTYQSQRSENTMQLIVNTQQHEINSVMEHLAAE